MAGSRCAAETCRNHFRDRLQTGRTEIVSWPMSIGGLLAAHRQGLVAQTMAFVEQEQVTPSPVRFRSPPAGWPGHARWDRRSRMARGTAASSGRRCPARAVRSAERPARRRRARRAGCRSGPHVAPGEDRGKTSCSRLSNNGRIYGLSVGMMPRRSTLVSVADPIADQFGDLLGLLHHATRMCHDAFARSV